MKSIAIPMALLTVVLIYCHPAEAKCLSIPVSARGTISGDVQDGDMLFLRFIYSHKRVESTSPQEPQGQTFTITGAYSTFKRHGIFVADICNGHPRQIQVVMQDKNGTTLDAIGLTARDPSNGVTEMNYGKTQSIVLHRRPVLPR